MKTEKSTKKGRPNLRLLYVELKAIPYYCPAPNRISPAEAQEIADRFREYANDTQREIDYANECGNTVMTRPDSTGKGLGQFHNAARMYFSALYELHYVAHCEDAEALRNGDFQD